MAVCDAARRSGGEHPWALHSISIQNRAPLDGDCIGTVTAGASASRHLHRSECFLQPGRAGHSLCHRLGCATPPGLVSPRSPEHPFAAVAEYTRDRMRLGVAVRGTPPPSSPHTRTGGVYRSDLLWD